MSFARALPLLAIVTASAVDAQAVIRRVGDDIANAGKDVVAIWISPFDASGRDWLSFGGVLAVSALVSPFDDEVDRWAVHNRDAKELSFLDEFRRGGAVYGGNRLVPVAAAAYIIGVAIDNRDLRDGIFGCIASYASGSVLRNQVLYRLVARTRPDTARRREEGDAGPPGAKSGDQYDFDFPGSPDDWGQHSTPGGHVANIAACASYLGNRFHMGAVEPVLYAVVGAVGVGRLLDRGHWASDQVLGTIFGYAIGREIAKRQIERADRAAGRSVAAAMLAPAAGLRIAPSSKGLTVAWSRRF